MPFAAAALFLALLLFKSQSVAADRHIGIPGGPREFTHVDPAPQEDIPEARYAGHGAAQERELRAADDHRSYLYLFAAIVLAYAGYTMVQLRRSQRELQRDIAERKLAEEALFREKERAQVTLQSIGDGVITTDARGTVTYLNPIAEQLTGWRNAEACGEPLPAVCQLVDEVSGSVIDNPIEKTLSERRVVSVPVQTQLLRRDGGEFAVELTASPIRDRGGAIIGAVTVLRDITEMRGLARKISHQATHDALTGLVNRHEFERRLEKMLDGAKQDAHHHALCYIDLDQFKVVNDTCGHVAGDELLRQLSSVLQGKIRSRDTLARLGGDEFGVLLGECPMQQARLIANTLCQSVHEFRFAWQDKTFEVGASIGLVAVNEHSESMAQLLSAADAACYAAKDKGRNRVYVYAVDDSELLRRQGEMQWVARINNALAEDGFQLHCQKIMKLSQRRSEPEMYEVLLRMVDDRRRMVLPMAFIPAAERYNIMPMLDRWVIDRVLSQYDMLREVHAGGTAYAINLSAAALSDDQMLDFIKERLALHAVPPGGICFEITETVAIANMTRAVHFVNELKGLGCRFSLDDFGGGLSSFSYLKHLPVDFLKIDGSFVRDMVDDPIDHAMVASINHIGHVMGIATIAESVENEAVLNRLRELDVDFAQGFGIEKPRLLIAGAAVHGAARVE